MRLAASPVRTDDNLSDTGTLRLSGSFGAAEKAMDTPLALRLSLESAQLGQFTRLIYGIDRGWRGAVDATGFTTSEGGDGGTINLSAVNTLNIDSSATNL